MLFAIATFHDIAHHIDKKNHEKLSADIFYNNEKMKEFFSESERILIKEANPPKVISLSERGLSTDGVNLVAHRGFSAVAPENTAAAFCEAGKSKFFASFDELSHSP